MRDLSTPIIIGSQDVDAAAWTAGSDQSMGGGLAGQYLIHCFYTVYCTALYICTIILSLSLLLDNVQHKRRLVLSWVLNWC